MFSRLPVVVNWSFCLPKQRLPPTKKPLPFYAYIEKEGHFILNHLKKVAV